jgi:hypothetical protein
MEIIEIENFKGIKSLRLEVRPFTVLIGPQSVGKSVTAKLLYFFRRVILFLAESNPKLENLEERLVRRFHEFLQPTPSPNGPSLVRYTQAQSIFELKLSEGAEWKITVPPWLDDAFHEFRRALPNLVRDELEKQFEILSSMQDLFVNRAASHLPGGVRRPWFIPAGRSFYVQVEKDAASYFEHATVDPFIREFGKHLAALKVAAQAEGDMPRVSSPASKLVQSLLSGQYVRAGGKDFIDSLDGRRLPSTHWSSGQQESFPLALLLRLYTDRLYLPGGGISLFIEEPEAHLFPASQQVMMQLISLAFNSAGGRLDIFITTHSPYVLSSLNVLLKAGQIRGNPSTPRKLEGIVSADQALSPSMVSAFYMDRQQSFSIIDPDTGLIGGSAIDDVSGQIAEQFDALLELEA